MPKQVCHCLPSSSQELESEIWPWHLSTQKQWITIGRKDQFIKKMEGISKAMLTWIGCFCYTQLVMSSLMIPCDKVFNFFHMMHDTGSTFSDLLAPVNDELSETTVIFIVLSSEVHSTQRSKTLHLLPPTSSSQDTFLATLDVSFVCEARVTMPMIPILSWKRFLVSP